MKSSTFIPSIARTIQGTPGECVEILLLTFMLLEVGQRSLYGQWALCAWRCAEYCGKTAEMLRTDHRGILILIHSGLGTTQQSQHGGKIVNDLGGDQKDC